MSDGVLHAVAGTLFQFDESSGQFRTHGSVGCAILGNPHTHTYQLVCYVDSTQYICTARITSNNDTSLQYHSQGSGPSYSTFRDDNGTLWSVHFSSEDECITFGANIALAMYGAAGLPTHSVIAADLTPGKKDTAPVRAHNHVRGRYTIWMVQRSPDQVPKLGPVLDQVTEPLHQFVIPSPISANAMNNTSIGFEPHVIGMYREGKRFCVVPATCRRPGSIGGNQATLCFMVEVVKVKVESQDGPVASHSGATSGRTQAEMSGAAAVQGGESRTSMDVIPSSDQATSNSDPTMIAFEQFMQFQKMQREAQAPLQITMQPLLGNSAQAAVSGQVGQPSVHNNAPNVMYSSNMHSAPAMNPSIQHTQQAFSNPYQGLQTSSVDAYGDKIERANSAIGTVLTLVRDLTEKHEIFAHDWKVSQNKSKPTTLSNAQLEHSVKSIIEENDRLKDNLSERNDLIHAMEARIKEIQMKYDKLAASATTLMDEKKAAVHASSDMKLELDRQLLKAHENLSRVTTERDDLQRHVTTVKKLLDISDNDLREAKGKVEVATIQLQSSATKISSLDDQLNEERARRKALESRVLALTDQVKDLTDEMRQKENLLEERRRKMEADRTHFMELIEEDRRKSEGEISELRQEMMRDLQGREKRFQEERARAQEDALSRGHAEGREAGIAETRLVYEARLSELNLQMQRTQGELESQRLRLKTTEERSVLEMRAMTEQMKAVQETLQQQTSRCAALESEVERCKDYVPANKVSQERERIYSALTDIAVRLQNPIPPTVLRQILIEHATGRVVDLSFDNSAPQCSEPSMAAKQSTSVESSQPKMTTAIRDLEILRNPLDEHEAGKEIKNDTRTSDAVDPLDTHDGARGENSTESNSADEGPAEDPDIPNGTFISSKTTPTQYFTVLPDKMKEADLQEEWKSSDSDRDGVHGSELKNERVHDIEEKGVSSSEKLPMVEKKDVTSHQMESTEDPKASSSSSASSEQSDQMCHEKESSDTEHTNDRTLHPISRQDKPEPAQETRTTSQGALFESSSDTDDDDDDLLTSKEATALKKAPPPKRALPTTKTFMDSEDSGSEDEILSTRVRAKNSAALPSRIATQDSTRSSKAKMFESSEDEIEPAPAQRPVAKGPSPRAKFTQMFEDSD